MWTDSLGYYVNTALLLEKSLIILILAKVQINSLQKHLVKQKWKEGQALFSKIFIIK